MKALITNRKPTYDSAMQYTFTFGIASSPDWSVQKLKAESYILSHKQHHHSYDEVEEEG